MSPKRSETLFGRLIDFIVETFQTVFSNKPVFALIFLGTGAWILYNRFSPHPFDDWRAWYPGLIFTYTVMWGLVEGAVKIAQVFQAKRDEHNRILLMATLESVEQLAVDIRAELDRAKERDEHAADRDEVLIALANQIIDDIENKKKGLA